MGLNQFESLSPELSIFVGNMKGERLASGSQPSNDTVQFI